MPSDKFTGRPDALDSGRHVQAWQRDSRLAGGTELRRGFALATCMPAILWAGSRMARVCRSCRIPQRLRHGKIWNICPAAWEEKKKIAYFDSSGSTALTTLRGLTAIDHCCGGSSPEISSERVNSSLSTVPPSTSLVERSCCQQSQVVVKGRIWKADRGRIKMRKAD